MTTAATLTTIVDSTGYVGWFTSLALNSSGYPLISYSDPLNGGRLKIAVCGNATCTAGNIITIVDSVGHVGQHPSLALTANDFPVISYWDAASNIVVVSRLSAITMESTET